MAHRKDFVPESDAEFDAWESQFVKQLNALAAELDVTPEQLDRLNSAHQSWEAVRAELLAARKAARAATRKKNATRAELKQHIRLLTRRIQCRTATTDGQRASLGINVPDREPTRRSADAIRAIPPPLLHVDHSVAGQAVIHFGTNPRNERRNAIPKGVECADIWCRYGGAAAETDWRMIGGDTHSPFVHQVLPGTRVAYKARWLDSRMRPGPFSDVVEAIISV